MQWSKERQAGFSTASAQALPLPIVTTGPFGYKNVNVADQTTDPDSLLSWTKELIKLRRQCPEWGWGICHAIPSGEPAVFAHGVEWKGRRLIAVHNLSDKAGMVRLEREPGCRLIPMLSSRRGDHAPDALKLDLEPYGYRWYRLEPHA
jgi:maltose alpha-D-glucosyltransferase/alpha-amylase